jgi:hypothetical protein
VGEAVEHDHADQAWRGFGEQLQGAERVADAENWI